MKKKIYAWYFFKNTLNLRMEQYKYYNNIFSIIIDRSVFKRIILLKNNNVLFIAQSNSKHIGNNYFIYSKTKKKIINTTV